jgi:AraC-like DNA-binding protein
MRHSNSKTAQDCTWRCALSDEYILVDIGPRADLCQPVGALLGVTPKVFRIESHARRAWNLLQHSSSPLTEIAHQMGFADHAHLSRTIRALTGAPPSYWRTRAFAATPTGQVDSSEAPTPNAQGAGSRIGRTRTAPLDHENYRARFVFTSCQDVTSGAQNAYRRMIYDDERSPEEQQIDFVFHQGDFIYEVVNYPEDRPQGYYDRRLRDVIRYPHGEKIRDFHIPTTLEDYRTAYRGYLHDPDLQDARALAVHYRAPN